MKCQNCQFDNPAEAKFCSECGSKIESNCRQCCHINPPGSKFCNECGHNLADSMGSIGAAEPGHKPAFTATITEPARLLDGERRQATIVFSDLSGCTAMNERLDPEGVEAIMSRIKEEAVRIVERHEGIVNQLVGHILL